MRVEQLQVTIQEYLGGKMSLIDKTNFEREIKNSEALAEEIRQFRQLRILNKNKKLIEANAILNDIIAQTRIEPEYGNYKKYFRKSLWEKPIFRWLLGGCVLLTLVTTALLYQKNKESEARIHISKTYLKPMENIIGFAPNDSSQEAKAMRAYEHKNYSEAIVLLNYALKKSADDNSLRLYLAVSYLMEGQNDKAETLLQNIIKANDIVAVPAQWYLALSLLQRGEKTEAKRLLDTLETDKVFGKQAKEILSEI